MRSFLAFLFLLPLPPFPDAPPPDHALTTIEVEAPNTPLPFSRKDLPIQPGTYHYRVFVPAGYNADTARRYPALFICSPGGNATMNNVAERLRRDKWVCI